VEATDEDQAIQDTIAEADIREDRIYDLHGGEEFHINDIHIRID